jgi:serine/threonine protein kinase
VLGQGSFGRVFLVNENSNQEQQYACKVISKQRIIKKKQVEHTIHEKNLLFCTSSRFLVGLNTYFQDRNYVYLILDYVGGGELFSITQRLPTRRYSSEQARFIAGAFMSTIDFDRWTDEQTQT